MSNVRINTSKKKYTKKWFSFFLLTMNVIASASVSIYIPCMKTMVADFGTTNSMLQMSIVASLIGEFLGRFFSAPLFNAYSNKKIIVNALRLSIFGHFGCYLSNSIWVFLILRFVQALGSSVIYIASIGIINSNFNEQEKSSIIGVLELYQPVAWILSPFAGGLLAEMGSWRWSFIVLMILQILGLFVFFEYKEKFSPIPCHKFTFKKFFNDYKIILRNTYFLTYALIPGMFAGGYMIFASNSPFICSKFSGDNSLNIAVFQAVPLLFYILGTLIYRAIARDFGIRLAKWAGVTIYVIFGIYITLLLAGYVPWTAKHLLALMCVQCMGSSFLVPVSVLKAIQSACDTSYAGAATVVVFRNLIMSLCITASVRFSESIIMIMGAVFMTVATVLILITMRKITKIRRRKKITVG